MNIEFHPKQLKILKPLSIGTKCAKLVWGWIAAEIHAAVHRAAAMPDAWIRLSGDVRRVLVNRFPYGVLYESTSARLLVLAVMHLRREPGTGWHVGVNDVPWP